MNFTSNMRNEHDEPESASDVYLDANVFIYAVLDDGPSGENARKIIGKVWQGKYKAYTSVLTFDEVLWAVQKNLGREKAAEVASNFLRLVNLDFVSVNLVLMTESIRFYLQEKLAPRDAIHFASMKTKKLNKIISADSDFDKIKRIKRIDFTKMRFRK